MQGSTVAEMKQMDVVESKMEENARMKQENKVKKSKKSKLNLVKQTELPWLATLPSPATAVLSLLQTQAPRVGIPGMSDLAFAHLQIVRALTTCSAYLPNIHAQERLSMQEYTQRPRYNDPIPVNAQGQNVIPVSGWLPGSGQRIAVSQYGTVQYGYLNWIGSPAQYAPGQYGSPPQYRVAPQYAGPDQYGSQQ